MKEIISAINESITDLQREITRGKDSDTQLELSTRIILLNRAKDDLKLFYELIERFKDG